MSSSNKDKLNEATSNDGKPLWLTRLALQRPVTICMLFISLLLFGGMASRLLPLEMFPGIDIPELYVNVTLPQCQPGRSRTTYHPATGRSVGYGERY